MYRIGTKAPGALGYRREPFTGQVCITLIFLWSLIKEGGYTVELWDISLQHQ